MKVLVTGGAGMFGSALTRKLRDAGHQVTVVDDLSRGRRDNVPTGVNLVVHDLKHGVPFIPNQFERIFHLAAMIGGVGKMVNEPFDSFQNACIDYHVLQYAAHSPDCRFLYMGTACEYPVQDQSQDKAGNVWLKEDQCFDRGANPESLYGWCKVLGEQGTLAMHKQLGIPVAILRAFNMYGPGEIAGIEKAHVIPALIQKFLRGDDPVDVWGTGDQERAFTFIDDAADAALLAIEKISDGTPINLGTAELVKIRTLAEMIRTQINPTAKLFFDLTKPMGVFTRAADISRAKQLLGWEPKTSLEEGIQKTIAWIKAVLKKD